MSATAPIHRWKSASIWAALASYLVGRLCQLWAHRLPTLLVVLLHVLPPAILALVHGSVLYGRKGILVFTACCLGVGGVFESLSLRTGFPFGRYYFTDVMGPKLFGLPFLLVLAYLGIGYCAWVMALLILGYRDKPLLRTRVVALPILAAFLMLAWDLAMDPQWASVDKAWVWRDGGPFFGVSVSNFIGWYMTTYLVFQSFAFYSRSQSVRHTPKSVFYWRAPILMYGICAGGNLLIRSLPSTPAVVTDASGRQWRVDDALAICRLISVLVMAPMALLAWLQTNERRRPG